MDNLFFSSISFTPPPHANPSQSTGIIFNTRNTKGVGICISASR